MPSRPADRSGAHSPTPSQTGAMLKAEILKAIAECAWPNESEHPFARFADRLSAKAEALSSAPVGRGEKCGYCFGIRVVPSKDPSKPHGHEVPCPRCGGSGAEPPSPPSDEGDTFSVQCQRISCGAMVEGLGENQDHMLIRLTHTVTRASVSVMGNPALSGGRHGSFLL